MLHLKIVSENKNIEQIAQAINVSKNWLDIKKVLNANNISHNLVPKIISSFFVGEIPNKLAFNFMKGFKKQHPIFDIGVDVSGKEKYIKIDKLIKRNITKEIYDVKQFMGTSQEGWVTFKFGCNAQFKDFDVIVGYAHKFNGNWIYSNMNQQEMSQFDNYRVYNESTKIPVNTVRSQGVAFKVFPLRIDEIKDSIETWLSGFSNPDDKVYVYPGYSTYTTIVLSNDSALDEKVETIDNTTLNALSFDLGSTCCPPQ